MVVEEKKTILFSRRVSRYGVVAVRLSRVQSSVYDAPTVAILVKFFIGRVTSAYTKRGRRCRKNERALSLSLLFLSIHLSPSLFRFLFGSDLP